MTSDPRTGSEHGPFRSDTVEPRVPARHTQSVRGRSLNGTLCQVLVCTSHPQPEDLPPTRPTSDPAERGGEKGRGREEGEEEGRLRTSGVLRRGHVPSPRGFSSHQTKAPVGTRTQNPYSGIPKPFQGVVRRLSGKVGPYSVPESPAQPTGPNTCAGVIDSPGPWSTPTVVTGQVDRASSGSRPPSSWTSCSTSTCSSSRYRRRRRWPRNVTSGGWCGCTSRWHFWTAWGCTSSLRTSPRGPNTVLSPLYEGTFLCVRYSSVNIEGCSLQETQSPGLDPRVVPSPRRPDPRRPDPK